ncbi:cell division protein [Streptomyces sp. NBRC 110611]|nr:cell division protein [Streptomyces sp. NBRC 110611]
MLPERRTHRPTVAGLSGVPGGLGGSVRLRFGGRHRGARLTIPRVALRLVRLRRLRLSPTLGSGAYWPDRIDRPAGYPFPPTPFRPTNPISPITFLVPPVPLVRPVPLVPLASAAVFRTIVRSAPLIRPTRAAQPTPIARPTPVA